MQTVDIKTADGRRMTGMEVPRLCGLFIERLARIPTEDFTREIGKASRADLQEAMIELHASWRGFQPQDIKFLSVTPAVPRTHEETPAQRAIRVVEDYQKMKPGAKRQKFFEANRKVLEEWQEFRMDRAKEEKIARRREETRRAEVEQPHQDARIAAEYKALRPGAKRQKFFNKHKAALQRIFGRGRNR